MEESKDTVIVTGLANDITREDFINHFNRIGDILKCDLVTDRCEGRVTYADSETAEKAVNELNGETWNGNKIKVVMADKFHSDYCDDASNKDRADIGKSNTASSNRSAKFGVGGKGGKGGVGGRDGLSGQDGEDGEPGPGGKGGKGGAGGRP